jgi:DNA-binding transcriptional LysR family regulator
MPIALTEHGAALQAGAQRILDAVQATWDDVAAVAGQIRGTVTLGTTLHAGPLDLARVLTNLRDRHPDVVIKLRQSRTFQWGSCNRSATGQWISPHALGSPTMSPISRRVESLSTIS